MPSVASALLLGLTSEGWSGHEVFYCVAPTIAWPEDQADSRSMARKAWPDVPLREEWFAGRKDQGFYDCSKAERMLGWKHA